MSNGVQRWEYGYVLLLGNPKDEFHLCTPDGIRHMRFEACSRKSDPRDCVIASFGLEGWEAFAEGQTHDLWFKRPVQG